MFSFLTEPSFPKAAIGLEKESVTALSLQREGRGVFGIKQAATVELPANLLEPNFLESNISNPGELAVLIEEAVTSAGLSRQKNWSVSLPSNAARTAILTLENAASGKDESEEILDWKAEQTFGAPAAELRITRYRIAPDREGRPRYFASAVKLSVIDEYETIFENFGWKAGLMLPRAVSESRWITGGPTQPDTMLISAQSDGFSAILVLAGEPAVVRSVTCQPSEQDDEIYRLLMFYNDRFAADSSEKLLDKILLVGNSLVPNKIREISAEALGRALQVLRPEEVGLNMPANALTFDEVAAPAGLAALGWR
jgi:Tfp pilus assembly PilM family ATPase